MKQLDFDFIDPREPSLRELMHEMGLETSTDVARKQHATRQLRRQHFADPFLHVPSVAHPLRADEAHSVGAQVN